MNKKEIIILAAIGAGVYILSQVKAMKTYIAPQYAKTAAEKVAEEENEHIRERTPLTPAVPMPRRIAEEIPDAATPAARRRMAEKIAIRKRTAKKIAEKIGKTVAEKIISKAATQPGLDWKTFFSTSSVMKIRDPMARMKKILEAKRLGKIPLLGSTRRIAIPISPMQAIRDRITRAAARKKAQKAAAQKKIRQEAAQKIGKIIGKKVAQKVVPRVLEETGGRTGMALYIYLKKKAAGMRAAVTQAVNAARTGSKIILPFSRWAGGRTGMALAIFLKKRAIALEQAAEQAKAAITRPTSKLFPGAERSRIIPYSESSKHSYYGPKSHKLQNEGYMVEWQKRHNNSIEAYNDRKLQYVLSHPEYFRKK